MYEDGEPPCDKLKISKGEIAKFRFLQPWYVAIARVSKTVASFICYFGTVK